jgi:hypothetical protein
LMSHKVGLVCLLFYLTYHYDSTGLVATALGLSSLSSCSTIIVPLYFC